MDGKEAEMQKRKQELYNNLGIKIMMLRDEKNYSRAVLSGLTGISLTFLYEIETGKKGFSAEVLFRLSDALDISVAELLDTEKENDCFVNISKILEKYDSEKLKDFVEGLVKLQGNPSSDSISRF